MSLTLLGWFLVVSSIAISALLFLPLPSMGSGREQLDLETCRARFDDIGARLKLGQLNEAEANAARLALFTRPRSSSWEFGQDLRGVARALFVAVAVFLIVAGIGAAISYVGNSPEAAGSGNTNDELLARLDDYARTIETNEPDSTAASSKLLPDVNTMIERLAARLETTPDDVEGWRTLGWSYFHTARYEEAATAFARAVALDPSSADLKRSYEEAKEKASGSDNSEAASSIEAEPAGKVGHGPGVERSTSSEAMPPPASDGVIRSMVDGLAARLESAPRDVDGWTRLMRSRVVLGEREVAAAAFRKALEVFQDDSAASSEITAVATELGLKAE